jgi:hypothetical protein
MGNDEETVSRADRLWGGIGPLSMDERAGAAKRGRDKAKLEVIPFNIIINVASEFGFGQNRSFIRVKNSPPIGMATVCIIPSQGCNRYGPNG